MENHEEIKQMAEAILERGRININGIMEGDLTPEQYVEKSGTPGLLGYTMSVLRTNPIVKEWYYSDGDRYNNHVLIDSLVNGLKNIVDFPPALNNHIAEYPFFSRAYEKYTLLGTGDLRDLLRFLYLVS